MENQREDVNFQKLKEDGNKAFSANDFDRSISLYENALQIANDDHEKATIMKNKAAVFLKLGDYEKAAEETSKVLNLFPKDVKALYRHCQALEHLDNVVDAFRIAKQLLEVEPNNKDTQSILQRLHEKVQKRLAHQADVHVKVTTVFNYAFNVKADFEKREKALNNILALSQESAGCAAMYKVDIINKIVDLLKVEKNDELRAICIRIISELCKNEQRAKDVIAQLGVGWFLIVMDRKDQACVKAGEYCFQTLLNTLTGLDSKNPDSKPRKELYDANAKEVDDIFVHLLNSSTSHSISGTMRDSVIKLLTRNIGHEVLNWSRKFVELGGLQRMMEIAGEMSEYKYESSMEITDSTRTLISVCLTRVYENMDCDKARKEYLDKINEFIAQQLLTPEIESGVRVVVAITVLLHGPLDIGNNVISREGILDMILTMAGSDDLIQQQVACECIVAAITKQDKAQAVLNKGIDILNKLYNSGHDKIRTRALVGLCKISSSGGTDASVHPLGEDSNKNLAVACRSFLVNSKDDDTKCWAVEGYSYLTLDADIKELLVKDEAALSELISVAKLGKMSSVYGVVSTFVNLCNAYDKPEILPEIIELAKFAKRHVPETHEFDKEEYVNKRILLLGKFGTASALVTLSKTESDNCKELICRVFNALCSQQELRGLVVQQGGVKILLQLSSQGTANGMLQAAQALARIGITVDPHIAFPGERCYEVIRPWLSLLNPACSGLMNFEALMGLCNIASMGMKTCTHILKEKGFGKIESYIYEDHLMLRRAAIQCMTNLATHPDVVQIFEGDNDKLKYFFLLMVDDDEETSKAAAGSVAMLTAYSEKCCDKILIVNEWTEILKQVLVNPSKEMRYRGVVIVGNIMLASKNNAEEIMKTDIMEILLALSVIYEDGYEQIRSVAKNCLKETYSIIKSPENRDSNDESD